MERERERERKKILINASKSWRWHKNVFKLFLQCIILNFGTIIKFNCVKKRSVVFLCERLHIYLSQCHSYESGLSVSLSYRFYNFLYSLWATRKRTAMSSHLVYVRLLDLSAEIIPSIFIYFFLSLFISLSQSLSLPFWLSLSLFFSLYVYICTSLYLNFLRLFVLTSLSFVILLIYFL